MNMVKDLRSKQGHGALHLVVSPTFSPQRHQTCRIFCFLQPAFLALAIILSLCIGEAFSAEYYVAPNGNDSNPGTAELPWRTIQKAANSVNPGDVVFVQPGDYQEDVSILRSGAPGNPIIFKANAPASEVKVKSFSVGSWDPNATHYIVIDGFTTSKGIGLYGNYNTVQNCIMEGYGVGISWHPTAHPP
ncbi:MAG: right-handed parallel beta-helix repeat-containing protein, partial [bacterium]